MQRSRYYRSPLSLSLLFLCFLSLLTACGTDPGSSAPAGSTPTGSTPTTGSTGISTTAVAKPDTSCPAPSSSPTLGTGRPAVLSSITPGTHQSGIYVVNSGTFDAPISSIIRSYNASTHEKKDLLNVTKGSISNAQVSADGEWVLFVQRLATHQDAIQLIRIDGAQLQTLYCAPVFEGNNPNIVALRWSPDNKQVIFDEGHDISASLVKLLSLTDGKVHVALTSPAGQPEGALPQTWLDKTHVYLKGFVPNSGAPDQDILLLDLAKGDNQSFSSLQKVQSIAGPCYDFDLNADRSKLYVGTCHGTPGMGAPEIIGPSAIVSVVPTGGTSTAVYANKDDAVAGFRLLSDTTVLVIINNTTGGTPMINAVYTLQLSSGTLKRLVPIGAFSAGADPVFASFNQAAQESWSNVSRDGSLYAVVIGDQKDQHLYIGSLKAGGFPDGIELLKDDNTVSFAGWSTI